MVLFDVGFQKVLINQYLSLISYEYSGEKELELKMQQYYVDHIVKDLKVTKSHKVMLFSLSFTELFYIKMSYLNDVTSLKLKCLGYFEILGFFMASSDSN